MLRSLRLKFLLLLFGVAAVALSGTIMLRGLMIRDFGAFLEGEREDRVYWMLADIEGAYERGQGWSERDQARDALRALTLGFEMRLLDEHEKVIIDTEKALAAASPLMKRRLNALLDYKAAGTVGSFVPYPVFLAGKQIGTLELRELRPAKEALFIRRSDQFLGLSVLFVGVVAVVLSVLFSRRLTRPINDLAGAASAVSRGDFTTQVRVKRNDEVGDLATAFNVMTKTLAAQELLRKKLIADVAHELRTPLGVMRAEMEAIMDGLIPNDPERLQSLYEETGRLRSMVNAIEDLNQAEASSLSLRPQRIKIEPFLRTIVERHQVAFHEKGVSFDLTVDGDLDLDADPERLSQIVLNLLSNAMKATERGGTVEVRVRNEGNGLVLTVDDTGRGIGPEDLPFIFERFYRGPGGGLGIGLTIVKELTEANGGTVEVKSEKGKGSVFTLRFPGTNLHNSS
jgi:two-component system, OmpR family, sensor histidine kinase BaeS